MTTTKAQALAFSITFLISWLACDLFNIAYYTHKANNQPVIKHSEEFLCDSCGKYMYDENEAVGKGPWRRKIFTYSHRSGLVGQIFEVYGFSDEFLSKQVGPYKKRRYKICWECVLRNAGVKP